MKEKVMKRAIALVLAALILLGTLGYFFSMIAYGAEVDAGIIGDFKVKYDITYIEGGGSTIAKGKDVDFKITLEPQNNTAKKRLEDAKFVDISTNKSAFTKNNGSSLVAPKQVKDSDKYEIVLSKVTYNPQSSNKGKLVFLAMTEASAQNTLFEIEIPIKECETEKPNDPGTDTPGTNDPTTPSLTSNMSYTIQKIYRSSNQQNVVFDSGDPEKNDPTINRGYYVDAMVQFSVPNVEKKDIIDGSPKISVLVDRGGFRFQSAKEGSITIERVIPADGGVICHVSLKNLYYTGSGNTLAFTVQSKDEKAERYIYQQFATAVDSCVPYTPSPDNDDDDTPDYSSMQMATPYVIVSNYSYGGQVTAGDTFPLTLTFYNTSRNIDVTNMMITITMPDALMLTSSSNTFYVDQLDTESSVTETVQVTAKANAAPQSHNIDVSMKYQYIDDHLVSRRDNSTQETISIPVVQVDRFQVTGVDVSQEIYMNEESYLTVNFVNKGRSDVYNLSAEISGDIQNPGQQQNLGNLASGATGTADFYITPNAEGVCTGEVKITYEDTNMEEKTATILWSTNVVDPMAGMDGGMFPGPGGVIGPGMMEDPGLVPEEEPKSPTPFIVGGVAAAVLVVGFLVRRRILKKRSEEADANL